MPSLKTNKKQEKNKQINLFKDCTVLYNHLYNNVQKSLDKFFQQDYHCRLMGVSYDENIFFYGDEYFVNRIPVTKSTGITIKLSKDIISTILDSTLGQSNNEFELNNLTDIEANLIKAFTLYTYRQIENHIVKNETNPKIIKSAKEYNFTFFVKLQNTHIGKIIFSIPEYMIKPDEQKDIKETFSINDFKTTETEMKICVGTTKVTLNEIKAVEEGDIMVLENSNINQMSVYGKEGKINFRINPNPSLIISIENNGGNEMEAETNTKPQNMWDSILVDVVAEFDNVKLTLGELKQISEGLVIDVGSVYDNKIKLRVENQIIATGELVILNDRYGVRIENVKKNKEATPKAPAKPAPPVEQQEEAAEAVNQEEEQEQVEGNNEAGKENENFDYSDFEIEDESI